MKLLITIAAFLLPVISFSQESKQYRVFEFKRVKSLSFECRGVNVNDVKDTAILGYSWTGLGKRKLVTNGSIITVTQKGLKKKKTFLTLNN